MGTTQSLEEKNIKKKKNMCYNLRYNLVPSHSGHEYIEVTKSNLNEYFNFSKDNSITYHDLRSDFPSIINTDVYPFNPIASVSYLLQYSMLQNKLPIFPPSLLFIYKHISFYEQDSKILNFDVIFKSIINFGFCSENEFKSNVDNLDKEIENDLIERAESYKFINIYKVENDLDMIKNLIKNKLPILVGFTVYYDLNKISNTIIIPDKEIDYKRGGLSGVLVGYIDEREVFIMAMTYGSNFGLSGFLMVPYKFILDKNYTFEKYIISLNQQRIQGYIEQRREMINFNEDKTKIKKKVIKAHTHSLFS